VSASHSGLTVYVVDDEEPMRNALRRMLVAEGIRVECFASAAEFLRSPIETYRGCLLLDLGMPGMNGIELQATLAERGIRIPIIFLTGTTDVADAVLAMKGGAADFLQKPFDNVVLVARIRLVLDGEDGAVSVLDDLGEIRTKVASLTAREREVMQLVVMGNSSKMTGRALGVSHRTVEIHRARIMKKMEAASLAALVRMAMDVEAGPHPSSPP
jgi:FixJ family two-component response regulator